ncbi:ABC transporter permease subunit [Streptomyces sp. 3MP-14]|uniref:ABC transporter permease subunit n=1 Tax=Streptomyces mimosae TaxID=2586635 RepID=A0A5N6A8H8_9ACTN|nr:MULTISPECIES: sugar ABC transporter permease [Streptomyces]KAB8164239.1 ABC transporter permease subunit [Streptomyces mimosae]KAB8176516.1 ABC transporter permease subunit [Streptomyces sp. 3MP-14]
MASLTSTRTPRGAGGTTGKRRSTVPLLLGPFFVLFAFTYLGPILYAFGLSFFRERFDGIGWDGPKKVFAGFDNYTRALGDAEFLQGVGRVLLYGLVYVPLLIAFAALFALLLDSAVTAFRRTWQTILFLPHIVPGLIASIVWLYLYTPGLSPVLDGLEVFGWEIDFLHGATVLFSLVNIAVWGNLGFNVVLIFVALQAIPRSTIEAARLDGASESRIGLRIKLPQVLPAMVVATLFTIIGSLQLFTEPYILQASGNSSVSSTWTPNMLSYTAAFQSNDYHYAATVSVLVAVLAGVLSFTVTKLSNRRALR